MFCATARGREVSARSAGSRFNNCRQRFDGFRVALFEARKDSARFGPQLSETTSDKVEKRRERTRILDLTKRARAAEIARLFSPGGFSGQD
jgi:hypothetical protein